MKKKIIIAVLAALLAAAAAGLWVFKNTDFFSKDSSKNDSLIILTDTEGDFLLDDETEEGEPDITHAISSYVEVKSIGKYDESSETVEILVKAPDVNEYLMNNLEEIYDFNEQQLYDKIVYGLENGEIEIIETKIIADAEIKDGKTVVDVIGNKEYEDAVNGGLITFYNYLQQEYIHQLIEEEKDNE